MKNIKEIYYEYKRYENEINGVNIITGEINIKSNDINKNILIINSFENFKNNLWKIKDELKYENQKEKLKNVKMIYDEYKKNENEMNGNSNMRT